MSKYLKDLLTYKVSQNGQDFHLIYFELDHPDSPLVEDDDNVWIGVKYNDNALYENYGGSQENLSWVYVKKNKKLIPGNKLILSPSPSTIKNGNISKGFISLFTFRNNATWDRGGFGHIRNVEIDLNGLNYHNSQYLIFKDIICSSSGLNVSKEVVIPNVSDSYIDIKLYHKNIGITTASYSGSDPNLDFGTDLTPLIIENTPTRTNDVIGIEMTNNNIYVRDFLFHISDDINEMFEDVKSIGIVG